MNKIIGVTMTNGDIGILFTIVSIIVIIGVPILYFWRAK